MKLVHIDLTGSSDAIVRHAVTNARRRPTWVTIETIDGSKQENVAVVDNARHFALAAEPNAFIITELKTSRKNDVLRSSEIMADLRERRIKQPVLLLSNLPEPEIADVLEFGAQGWVPLRKDAKGRVPRSTGMLLRMQLAALLNFSKGQFGVDFKFGGFSLNRESGEIHFLDKALKIQPMAGKLLAELILAEGNIVPHEKLDGLIHFLSSQANYADVRDHMRYVFEAVREHLAMLGTQTGADGNTVETVKNVGYQLSAEKLERLTKKEMGQGVSLTQTPKTLTPQYPDKGSAIFVNLTGASIQGVSNAIRTNLRTVNGKDRFNTEVIWETCRMIADEPPASIVVAESQTLGGSEVSRTSLITRALRREGTKQPIIAVNNFQEPGFVEILRAGAQTVLPLHAKVPKKVFSVNGALLKAQMMSLHTFGRKKPNPWFEFHGLRVNRKTGETYLLGKKLEISHPSRRLLKALILAKGEILPRVTLRDCLGTDMELVSVDSQVKRLRRSIEKHLASRGIKARSRLVESQNGEGYYLNIPALDQLVEDWHTRQSSNLEIKGRIPSRAHPRVTHKKLKEPPL